METTAETVIGYKAFNNDMTCMNKFQYEVGKTYICKEPIQLCESGFHFCMIPIDVLKYYRGNDNKFAIIKAGGKIEHDHNKSVCSQITIEKLITLDELYNLPNGIVKYNGRIFYYHNGKFHREDGPAVEYTFGEKRWYRNNLLHREDGPAIEYANGDKEWYLNGLLHRVDGPAFYKRASGTKEWFINGLLHRLDGPAVELANEKKWFKNGKLHREDGPAIEYADGTKKWFKYGKLHRDDGPAIEWANGARKWYHFGSKKKFHAYFPIIQNNGFGLFQLVNYGLYRR